MAQKLTTRSSFVLALVAVGLLNVLGLSDCSRVEDSVTGPDAQGVTGVSGREDCVEWCDRTARNAFRNELRRHRDILRDCNGDPQCRADEEQRHEMELMRLRGKYEECLEECHDQGGGSGGQ